MAWDPPPLPQQQPDWLAFQVWWQLVIEDIKAQFTGLETAVADIQAAMALANANAALTAALIAANSTTVPQGTNGGTSDSVNSFASFNSTAHAAVGAELTVIAGSGGTVTLTAANLAVSTGAVAPAGVFKVYGKWEWDSTGAGVWVDVGTEDVNTTDCEVEDFGGSFGVIAGSLTSNEVKSGLAALSTHKFRFMARKFSGTRVMYLTGTASAVGS